MPTRLEASAEGLSRPATPWSRTRDLPVVLGLVAFTVAIRVPYRSRVLNAWDSVSFALSLEEYDVAAHRPHAPGYPIYSALGRLLYFVLGEANAALVWLSILMSAAAVALLYGFMREWSSRRAALAASMLLATAPIFLFNGLIALSYTSEAAASVGVAWLAWRASRRSSPRGLVALAVIWAASVGLRQSLFLFLAPVVLWAVWTGGTDLKQRLLRLRVVSVTSFVTAIAWLVPMVLATSGGFRGWRTAAAIQSGDVILRESVFRRGLGAFQEHFDRVGFYLHAEGTALIPVLFSVVLIAVFVTGAYRAAHCRPAVAWPRGLWPFLAVWLLPSLAFYWFIFSGWDRGPTGYILVLLPGVYLIFAALGETAVRLLELAAPFGPRLRAGAAWVGLFVLLIPLPSLVQGARPWIDNEVKAHDDWADSWATIRQEFPPNATAILTFYSWAHVKWYFPDYLVWGYFPIPRSEYPPDWSIVLETKDHRDDQLFYPAHARGADQPNHTIPAHVKRIVLFDFQFGGESGPRILRPDVTIHEAHTHTGWRLLYVDAPAGTVEGLFAPEARVRP